MDFGGSSSRPGSEGKAKNGTAGIAGQRCPRIHICNLTQILPGLPSKWAASHMLMCISKTKEGEDGGQKMDFDFSEIYGRDEISFE